MIKIAIASLAIATTMAISPITFAHHNSSTPEGVDPGWYGLENSPHNEQVDFAMSQQYSGTSQNTEMSSQSRSSYMESAQRSSQSGDTLRSRVH